MTIRFKVLLVVALTMGLVLLMGGVLARNVSTGRASRERLIVTQEQIDSFGRLHIAAERYLRALLRARYTDGDTAELLHEMLGLIDQEEALLRRALEHEQSDGTNEERPEEWGETAASLEALRKWASRVEDTVRTVPLDMQLVAAEWRLFDEFEKDVGQLITKAQQAEYLERSAYKEASEARLRKSEQLAILFPAISCTLLLGLALIVLVPMRSALKELLGAARRIGEGNLEVALSTQRKDELGTLSLAFNQMAAKLKQTLEEKEQLMRAEAEASEREVRRYNALLEETVRTRTAELEQTNKQLTDSLQQLKTTQAQLIFADRLASMGQVAAGVAHEINNPLSYVISNLSYLNKELNFLRDVLPAHMSGELLEVVSEAREGAERVRLIVRDLKVLARPDEGGSGPTRLDEVVRSAAKIAARELYQRARLVEDCGSVPPVRGSATRLGQVFLNLLINAAHAIPRGREEENEIRVLARVEPPGTVVVEVSDTGAGIPPEHLGRIFDPFFTTKPVGEGTGLGLSVCHSIITSLGGELQVQSELGRGTTFRITLPVAESAPSAPPQAGRVESEKAS